MWLKYKGLKVNLAIKRKQYLLFMYFEIISTIIYKSITTILVSNLDTIGWKQAQLACICLEPISIAIYASSAFYKAPLSNVLDNKKRAIFALFLIA